MCEELIWICVLLFQAEDGIRDGTVTGVQTCALPIWEPKEDAAITPAPSMVGVPMIFPVRPVCQTTPPVAGLTLRTEPSYLTPPIVVRVAARNRCVPSNTGAATFPPPLAIARCHTGPAGSADVLKA